MIRTGPTEVLIVDDSALARAMLTSVLAREPDIHVVGAARDAFEARELIIQHRPDVIVLDVEMPRMNGLTFLKRLMAHYPVPVIMCSSITTDGSPAALEAIELGAVDVVAKPTAGGTQALRALGEDLADKIRAATVARPVRQPAPARAAPASFRAAGLDPNRYLVAIGASTGGTEAIRALLANVPADFPPVAIVQHMPAGFTQSFAGRLDRFSALTVREAVGKELLGSGLAFLARGGIQMTVTSVGGRWHIAYGTDEPVNRHCPSVDVLFDSVAKAAGRQAIGILLTGMGADGAQGLLRMRQAGAITIGQDQDSCVVYGMPKVAFEIGAVQQRCPPAEAPAVLLRALRARDLIRPAAPAR